MLTYLGAVALLAAFGTLGITAVRRAGLPLDSLECLAYGFPLGTVLASLALLALASLVGLGSILVLLLGAGCVGATFWLRPPRSPARARGIGTFSAVILGALFLRWLVLWSGAVTTDHAGMWVSHRNLWGDWAQHLGDVSSFAYGNNFPPSNPRFPGSPFAYHYLASVTTAALVKLGLEPAAALCLHSLVYSCFLALSVYAFAKRLTSRGTGGLAVLLFFIGGGLGWWKTVQEALGSTDPLRAILERPWDPLLQAAGNFRWLNVYFALIAPQRGWLYGLPLALLALSLLVDAVETRRGTSFFAAGIVAGLLPFCHLPSILALALITPVLFTMFHQRGWIAFFGGWAILTAPQVWLLQAGGAGAARAFRFAPGWVAAPDPWLWFWFKNLGLLLPLLLVAIGLPSLCGPKSRRFLLAFMPMFVAANLFVFQPWDWDNSKLIVYWYLGACVLVAALLARAWRTWASFAARALLGVAVVSLLLSGLLENLDQLLGRDRHLLLTAEELDVARRVRAETDPRALFACGTQHNHPVPVLSGRRVLLGYPGWLWSQGLDASARERELSAILSLKPDAPLLLERYGVDYVVTGPWERNHLHADVQGYRERYPCVIRTASYEVFDVRVGRAGPLAPALEPNAVLEGRPIERDPRPDGIEKDESGENGDHVDADGEAP